MCEKKLCLTSQKPHRTSLKLTSKKFQNTTPLFTQRTNLPTRDAINLPPPQRSGAVPLSNVSWVEMARQTPYRKARQVNSIKTLDEQLNVLIRKTFESIKFLGGSCVTREETY